MIGPLSVGQVVRHPKYGKGTIQAIMEKGQIARVYFDLILLPRHIPVIELILLETPQTKSTDTTPTPQFEVSIPEIPAGFISSTPPPKVDEKICDAPPLDRRTGIHPQPPTEGPEERLVVECLRQGLPPCGSLNDWTVGFRAVRGSITKALEQAASENGTGSIFILEAGYGQGKSHVGQWARETALSNKLMTMDAELDDEAISLSNGMGLLSRLFASAVLPNTTEMGFPSVPGLGTVLKHAGRKLRGFVPKGLDLFTSFLEIADSWEGNEEAVELLEHYLSGDGKRLEIARDLQSVLGIPFLKLPALKVNWGVMEDRLKAQASLLLRVVRLGKAAGAKGALIVLDEFDYEFMFSPSLSWKAQELLDRMCGLAEKESIVFLFLIPSNADLEVNGASRLKLPRLDTAEFKRVCLQTIGAYRNAFPKYSAAGGEETLFEGLLDKYKKKYQNEGWGPRFFVRATIEACDRAASMMVPLSEVDI